MTKKQRITGNNKENNPTKKAPDTKTRIDIKEKNNAAGKIKTLEPVVRKLLFVILRQTK